MTGWQYMLYVVLICLAAGVVGGVTGFVIGRVLGLSADGQTLIAAMLAVWFAIAYDTMYGPEPPTMDHWG